MKVRYAVCLGIMGWHLGACEPPDMAKLTVPAAECACDAKVSDQFENPIKYNFGKYAGQCVDSCRFRSSKKISETANRRVVSNFHHDGRFWIADIPLDGVEKVDVIFEKFAPKISHVMLRFRFAAGKPVLLTSQLTGEKMQLQDLLVSPEGMPPKDGKYSMIEGLMNEYLLGYRVMSVDAAYQWGFVKYKHPYRQYRLNVKEGAERRRLLEAGLNASESRSFHQIYNLLANNCATSVLDLVYGENGKPKDFEAALPVDLMFGTLSQLRRKGFLSGGTNGSGLPNLEQEMNL